MLFRSAGGNVGTGSRVFAKYEGQLIIDELRSVDTKSSTDQKYKVVIGRSAEYRIIEPKTEVILASGNIPYGAKLFFENNATIKKGDLIVEWDPYNAVIITEVNGKVAFENVVEGITFRVESDDQTGLQDKVVIESRQKAKNPAITIVNSSGEVLKI